MIRFPCPHCHRTLKAPEERAGAAVVCPRCQEVSLVPSSVAVKVERGGAVAAVGSRNSEQAGAARALFSGMSTWLRWAVALVVAAGVLSLLLALLAPALRLSEDFTATAREQAPVVILSCLVILFVLLHGHGTSCPSCGKWWAREEGDTESLGREEVEKKGVAWVRARRRTTYACKHCRHTWTADFTDEYQGTLRSAAKGRRA